MTEENVISLFPEEPEPYLSGICYCLGCRYEWIGCCPVGTTEFECPSCNSMKGRMKFEVIRDEDHYKCNCGNIYFCLTPNSIYCPNCGEIKEPYE